MDPLLSIENLVVDFVNESSVTNAVKNVSLQVHAGEIVALVGESGSGKSVTSLSVLQLLPVPPARYTAGKILFHYDGSIIDLLSSNANQIRKIRGNKIGMIFQEPMSS